MHLPGQTPSFLSRTNRAFRLRPDKPSGQVKLWLLQCRVLLQDTNLSYPPPHRRLKGFKTRRPLSSRCQEMSSEFTGRGIAGEREEKGASSVSIKIKDYPDCQRSYFAIRSEYRFSEWGLIRLDEVQEISSTLPAFIELL